MNMNIERPWHNQKLHWRSLKLYFLNLIFFHEKKNPNKTNIAQLASKDFNNHMIIEKCICPLAPLISSF
jgi:hypothetical protein